MRIRDITLEEWIINIRQAVAERIIELCRQQGITPNALSYRAAVHRQEHLERGKPESGHCDDQETVRRTGNFFGGFLRRSCLSGFGTGNRIAKRKGRGSAALPFIRSRILKFIETIRIF